MFYIKSTEVSSINSILVCSFYYFTILLYHVKK
nr:MAG TPA: hypothetical protein [Caudoviricetes sp.]